MKIEYPKDAVILPPGMTPPKNYQYAYTTRVPKGFHIIPRIVVGTGRDERVFDYDLDDMEVERWVYIPITEEK